MTTYKELVAQKVALEAQLQQARATEVANVIETIRGLMAEYDLTVEDLASKHGRRPKSTANAKGKALPPKYMNPKTGQTWSGRGRAPSWVGKRPERFLIQPEQA